MRAQQSFVSESGARFSVGVGCLSFGGQRPDRGGLSRLRARVVTGLKPLRHAEQAGCLALNSRLEATSRVAVLCESLFLASVVVLGQPMAENSLQGWPNLKYQMPEVSTRQRHASGQPSKSFAAVAALRSRHLLAQPDSPNIFVKGTSRKRAAPYVGR